MDKARMKLIDEARALHGNTDSAAHAALRRKVMDKALAPDAVMAKSQELGAATAAAADTVAKARVEADRAAFRAWMRVQAAAEQDEMFEALPGATINKAQEV